MAKQTQAQAEMSTEQIVALVTQGVLAALGKTVTAPVAGATTVTRIAPKRTIQAVKWMTQYQDRTGKVIEGRATKQGELSVKNHPVAHLQARTELCTLNTGSGMYGMERVMVPQTDQWETILEALRKDDVPVALMVGNVRIDFVRNQGVQG